MIVSGGRLRGRRIAAPPGDAVRPTPARVKEALFAILAPRLEGARLLDAYAGTGAIGVEALSRGAAAVDFVEAHRPTAQALRETLARFGLAAPEARVHVGKAATVAARLEPAYDLVFADPPYGEPPPAPLFAALLARGLLAPGATVIYEHRSDRRDVELPPFASVRRERWGEVAMTFLAPPGA